MRLLDDLNSQQREAVTSTEGPVLVLAGAGSGKTRVITYRVARLIETGIPGESILAVTFTNKAAEQMKERIARLLAGSGRAAGEPWVSTFHSFCARMLRREAPRLGLARDFAIFDEDDQQSALKMALENLKLEPQNYTPRGLLERISFAKNHGLSPEQAAALTHDERGEVLEQVYAAYEAILKKAGGLDFDDLLLRAVEVLRTSREARENWQRRFQYLQVDEYQDTNRAQYELVALLAGEQRNLCVVGDEDQSIYSWRGADVGNILRFAEDFPNAKVVRLEENYRSTQNILDAAGAVVARNERRLGKQLRATRGAGMNLRFFEARDAAGEAEFVTAEIFRLQRENADAHVAVLYRTNFQSRVFEEFLRKMGVSYRIIGGFSFYHRAEVKDALAYLRLLINPDDDVALVRVLNTPPRGIGKITLDNLRRRAQELGASLWAALGETLATASGGRAMVPLRDFRNLVEGLRAERETLPPGETLRQVLERTGYLEVLDQAESHEERARAENLRELVTALDEAAERGDTLDDFLAGAALFSDADEFDERAPISLMTLHAAKGLEFDHVFLTGLEEGLFPHSRTKNSPEEMEEERRLCYVGMTRAKDTMTLTRAVYRRGFGNQLTESSRPSRFLTEIPGELIETVPGSLADAGETRRYEPDPEYSVRRYPAEASAKARRPPRPRFAAAAAPRNAGSHPLIGVRVRHPQYGMGTIIGVEGEDDDRKLTVSFVDYGTKKLLERYANLQRS
jgi:DNA helicase-2/ATP-dependent DNA helicase PcrA